MVVKMVANLVVKMVANLVGDLVVCWAEMMAEWKDDRLVVLKVVNLVD